MFILCITSAKGKAHESTLEYETMAEENHEHSYMLTENWEEGGTSQEKFSFEITLLKNI